MMENGGKKAPILGKLAKIIWKMGILDQALALI